MLTKEEIEFIAELVVMAGKSPVTGGKGVMEAAKAIGMLQRAADSLDKPVEKPRKRATNGKS